MRGENLNCNNKLYIFVVGKEDIIDYEYEKVFINGCPHGGSSFYDNIMFSQ